MIHGTEGRRGLIACLTIACLACGCGQSSQVPTVFFDTAHNNFRPENHGSILSYLTDNGFRVAELQEPFSLAAAEGADVIVIQGALADRNALPAGFTQAEFERAWSRPVGSAFTPREVDVLYEWVQAGGGLLLVFDHMPAPGGAAALAAAFGIEVSDGYAVDAERLVGFTARAVAEAGSIVFRRRDGTVTAHPVTDERPGADRIDSIATWTGAAFRAPDAAHSLLTLGDEFVSLLPDTAWVFSDRTERIPIGGWSQGAVMRVGEGRIAVFGEYGLVVSPGVVADSTESSNPQVQNPQLLINVLRWLSGEID